MKSSGFISYSSSSAIKCRFLCLILRLVFPSSPGAFCCAGMLLMQWCWPLIMPWGKTPLTSLPRSQVNSGKESSDPTNPPLLHTGWKSSLCKDLWEAYAMCGWNLTTPSCLEHVLTYETWGLSDGNAVISQECCQSYMLPYRFLNLEQSFGKKYSDRFLNGIWCSS